MTMTMRFALLLCLKTRSLRAPPINHSRDISDFQPAILVFLSSQDILLNPLPVGRSTLRVLRLPTISLSSSKNDREMPSRILQSEAARNPSRLSNQRGWLLDLASATTSAHPLWHFSTCIWKDLIRIKCWSRPQDLTTFSVKPAALKSTTRLQLFKIILRANITWLSSTKPSSRNRRWMLSKFYFRKKTTVLCSRNSRRTNG